MTHTANHATEIRATGRDALAEISANARLVAAAPELLATCKWVAQEIDWGHDMRASSAVLQQAIAKATT